MLIRFKKPTSAGSVKFQPGELIDLPSKLAEIHVGEGNAIAVPKAENAALRFEQPVAYPQPVSKPRPARRSR